MSANDFNPNDISLIAPGCEFRANTNLQPPGTALNSPAPERNSVPFAPASVIRADKIAVNTIRNEIVNKISAPPTDKISVGEISPGSVAVVNTAPMVEVKKSVNAARVEVKIINPIASLPSYQSEMAAGIDLVAAIDKAIVLQPGDQTFVPSGIAVSILQRDIGAFLFPRSSMGKAGLALANTVGVIDADYQGEIAMICVNRNATGSRKVIVIEPGQRIAQLVFLPLIVANLVQVDSFSAATERGAGGFGSTGEK